MVQHSKGPGTGHNTLRFRPGHPEAVRCFGSGCAIRTLIRQRGSVGGVRLPAPCQLPRSSVFRRHPEGTRPGLPSGATWWALSLHLGGWSSGQGGHWLLCTHVLGALAHLLVISPHPLPDVPKAISFLSLSQMGRFLLTSCDLTSK